MIQALIPLIGTVLDRVVPDKQAATQAKIHMLDLVQKGELAQQEADLKRALAQADIVKTEASSQHGLTAMWRPIVMLTFAGLITARWFGFAAPDLSEAEYIKLWDIVELGLGGYVIGRTVEKVTPTIAGAIRRDTRRD